MNIAEVLHNDNVLIVTRSGDLKEFFDLYRNNLPAEPEKSAEPKGPISQSDAAKILNRSRQTLVKWRKKGILKGFLIGGRVFFRPEDIDALQRIKLS